jgi:hypothetical protein
MKGLPVRYLCPERARRLRRCLAAGATTILACGSQSSNEQSFRADVMLVEHRRRHCCGCSRWTRPRHATAGCERPEHQSSLSSQPDIVGLAYSQPGRTRAAEDVGSLDVLGLRLPVQSIGNHLLNCVATYGITFRNLLVGPEILGLIGPRKAALKIRRGGGRIALERLPKQPAVMVYARPLGTTASIARPGPEGAGAG